MATTDTLIPAPATSYSTAYGGIPQVPAPAATQAAAIGANLGNLGQLYNLSGSANLFNQQQAALGLQTNLPGYAGMVGQSAANIQGMLAGKIPQDVVNLIAQQGAERGVAMGSPGSPNANAALLRALGLTSLGLQQQGEQELTAAIGRTPQGPIFDPSKFFVTPEQEQQAQAAANLYGSAPVPAAAAAAARQAVGGVGTTARPGGYQIVGGGGPPAPTTATGPYSPGVVVGQGGGGNLTYGGISYPQGQTPQSAMDAWTKWYSQIQKSPYAPGTSNVGATADLTPQELDELFYGTDTTTPSAPGTTAAQPFQPGDYETLFGDSTAPADTQNYVDWTDPFGVLG